VTAPGDGCAFALCDPVAVSGVAGPGKRWPLVLSAAFSRPCRRRRRAALRWRFFERHFQYLNAFDNLPDGPGAYDYFAVTAGPRTLARRGFRPQAPSASRIETAVNRLHGQGGMTAPGPRPAAEARRAGGARLALALHAAFRRDILSAQPERLYRAWMAEFRTPFFRSFLVNQPDLVEEILKARPLDFPKSDRVGEGLRPLLGASVFLTNGETWARQRRIIDPAFEGGRLRDTFPRCWRPGVRGGADGDGRPGHRAGHEPCGGGCDLSARFSPSRSRTTRRRSMGAFRAYQRSQPILNLRAFCHLPRWMPRGHRAETLRAARRIRALITELTERRVAEIAAGTAPDDLATKILTARDPETGEGLTAAEMVDQVAIFFLAGHETSASALSWTLYLLARYPEWQERVAERWRACRRPRAGDIARLGP
jgi:hypothetical protein